MKNRSILSILLGVLIIISSCSTSNSVSNNRLISKRKYTKGFHFNSNSRLKDDGILAEKTAKNEAENVISSRQENVAYNNVAAVRHVDVISDELPTDVMNSEISESYATARSSQETISENNLSSKSIDVSKKDISKKDLKKDFRTKKESNQGGGTDAKFILAVILAFLFPALGVLVYTYPSIDWIKVLIAFLLTLLFWLPGIIYALLVVFDVI
jgi:uncharacterized membrane protein YqaE (UPF0057 family)